MRSSVSKSSADGRRPANAARVRAKEAADLLGEALALLRSEQTSGRVSEPRHSTDRLLRLPEVQRLCGLRKSAIYEHMRRGTFPRSVKVGVSATTWSEAAIQAWIADRITGGPT